jgi:YD repeat-containing protein
MELIREVVDPNGAALTTSYSFYQVSSEVGRFRRLKSVTNPDWSWEQYDYDSTGARVLVLRPWKDQPLATATEANSYAIRTTYSNTDGIDVALDAKFVSSVEEKIAGATIRKTVHSRTGTTVNGEPAVIENQTVYYHSMSV